MRRAGLLGAAVLALFGCGRRIVDERPYDLCTIVALSDYQVVVTPKVVRPAITRELSPWPGEPQVVSPVEFEVARLLLSAPLPNVPSLPQDTVVALVNVPPPVGVARHIGLSRLDGEWFLDTSPTGQFTATDAGWRRAQADYSWDTETFATLDALDEAFADAGARCARVDWISGTREANRARSGQ